MIRCRVSLLVVLVVLCAVFLLGACGATKDLNLGQTDAAKPSSSALSGGLSKANVTITNPTSGKILDSTAVNVEWYGTENGATISSYDVQLDGNPSIAVGTTTNYTFDGLSQSPHYVIVTVHDSISNTNVTSVSFFVDTSDPTVTITSPASGSYLNTSDVIIEWEGADEGMGISYYDVQLDGNPAIPVGIATSWTNLSLTETMHTVIITAHDGSGRTGSDVVSFFVDITKPTVSIIGPENGFAFNQSSGSISWTGGDEWSGLVHYEVWLNEKLLFNASTDSTSCSFGSLKEGSYLAMVRAVDRANNAAEATVSFNIDTVEPTLAILSPEEGAYINQDWASVEWLGNGTGSTISYLYSLDSNAFVDVGTATSQQLESLSSGSHTVKIEARDAAGNQVIKEVSFIVDLGSPTLVIDTPLEGALFNSSSVPVTWTASDDSGLDHIEIKVDDGLWITLNFANVYQVTMLSNGPHLVQMKALDKSGNVNITSVHFNVDLEAPTATSHAPLGNDVGVSEDISVAFSEGMNPDTISLTINGVSQTFSLVGNTLVCDPSTDFQYDTDYNVELEGKDMAGNSIHYEWSFRTTDMGRVAGRILNNAGSPVVGANVSLDTGEWALTDESGSFVIYAHAGSHNFSVSYPGLGTERRQVIVEAGGTKQVGDIQITPESLGIGWVVAVAALIVVGFLVYFNYQKQRKRPSLKSASLLKKKQPSFLSKKQTSFKKKQRKPPEDEF